jgi:methionyl-tRNA formyltransferase
MGTPDFSVPALEALGKSGHDIALVVTQPDRPKGRGRRLSPSPVKQTAIRLGYPVIQPESVRTDGFADQLKSLDPDIIVVIAYGHILSKTILSIPRIGAINIHASLLPRYRGSAPIQWAIINGEKESGVTAMMMDEGVDTGDILLSSRLEIGPDETSASLHDRLAALGADLLIRVLDRFEAGSIESVPQDHRRATYAPLLRKKDGRIDWSKPAKKIDSHIRGVSPWPGAYTFHNEKRLKIFSAKPLSKEVDVPPGTVVESFSGELWIAAGKGLLSILEVQSASGKRLGITDFLRGHAISPGTVLK